MRTCIKDVAHYEYMRLRQRLARHAGPVRLRRHRQMTISSDFGGVGVAQYIRSALGFPRLGLWDSSLLRVSKHNIHFGTLFGDAVGFDPFETHLGVPIQRRVSVYLCCAEGAQVPQTKHYV